MDVGSLSSLHGGLDRTLTSASSPCWTPAALVSTSLAFNGMHMSLSNGTTLMGYDVLTDGRMELVIHNGVGQVVSEQNFGVQGVGSYQHTINTNGWNAGVYYVTVKNNGQSLTKKLIVQQVFLTCFLEGLPTRAALLRLRIQLRDTAFTYLLKAGMISA